MSPYNFIDEVTGQFDLPQKVEIHDATLRDGEQTPGVVFRKDDKVRITKMLDEVGVERIEAGMPAVSEEDFEAIKAISKLGLNAKIFTFARALPVDIDMAMFATAPQVFGREGEVLLGKKSGKASITYTLEKLGIQNVGDETVLDILKEVKQKGAEKRALLTTEEFKEILARKVN